MTDKYRTYFSSAQIVCKECICKNSCSDCPVRKTVVAKYEKMRREEII